MITGMTIVKDGPLMWPVAVIDHESFIEIAKNNKVRRIDGMLCIMDQIDAGGMSVAFVDEVTVSWKVKFIPTRDIHDAALVMKAFG